MKSVSSYEAKTHLPELLRRAEAGEAEEDAGQR